MRLRSLFTSAAFSLMACSSAVAQTVVVNDYFVLNGSPLSGSVSKDVTLNLSGNGGVSGIQWVTDQVELSSFSISITPGTPPAADANGYWIVVEAKQFPATVVASYSTTPGSYTPLGTGTSVNGADTVYKSGFFALGSPVQVTVPSGGSYVYGLSSKIWANMQFVQAQGTSATVSVHVGLSASISLQSNIAATTEYMYIPVPEPEAWGLAMAVPVGLFMVLRRVQGPGRGTR